MKPQKQSVSVVVEEPRGLLLVRRPDDDESLPGLWGLPAVTLEPGEAEADAVRRAGRSKLGVELRPSAPVGEENAERPDYSLSMRDWAADIVSGEPRVPQPAGGTQYTQLRWGEPADLVPAARAGSACCRVLLRARDLDWER
ncbi:MAG TPA: NUDIX domain-containing protein [Thermoleophilaceae bacterium]|nr:NUDIX domain-containing protein [Thermoleophilaceae bacterium]